MGWESLYCLKYNLIEGLLVQGVSLITMFSG